MSWLSDRWGKGPSVKGLKSSIKGTGHFVGKVASNPFAQIALGALTGGIAAPLLAGVAGGALKKGGGLKGAVKGGASAGLSAAGGPLGVLGKLPGVGKVGSAASSVLSKIPGAERAVSIGRKVGDIGGKVGDLGSVIQGTFPGQLPQQQGDGGYDAPLGEGLIPAEQQDRYRSVNMGGQQQGEDQGWLQTALGFLGDHKDDILDYGSAAEQIADRHRRNKMQDEGIGMARGDLARRQPLRDAGMAGLMDQSRPDLSSVFNQEQPRYRRVAVGSRT